MKHALLTFLLTGIALTAVTQNKKMTKEEKDKIMQELNMFYRIETLGVSDQSTSKPLEIKELPWEWEKKNKGNASDFIYMVDGFQDAKLEAVEENPDACRIVFCCPVENENNSYVSSGVGSSNDFYTDDKGNRTGFHKAFRSSYGLNIEIQFHLTRRNGKPVFIHPENNMIEITRGKRTSDNGGQEAYLALQFPITCPFSEITGGYVDAQLSGPEEYDRIELSASEAGKDVKIGDTPFRLEKIKDAGFVISAEQENAEILNHLDYFYRKDNKMWKPSSRSSSWGKLSNIMAKEKQNDCKTFEEWLEKKGIDPDNLEETLKNMADDPEDESTTVDRWGKRFNSGMTGEAILLYLPANTEKQPILASAQLFAPANGKATKSFVNTPLKTELQNRLNRANNSQTQELGKPLTETVQSAGLIATVLSKFRTSDVKGAPLELKADCHLSTAENDALLADNDAICYAMGVIQAERLMKDDNLGQQFSFSFPAIQQALREGFSRGMQTCKNNTILYSPTASLDNLNEELSKETEKAQYANPVERYGFQAGAGVIILYRQSARRDMPEINNTLASGQQFNPAKAQEGFDDYIQRQLKMGVQYANTLLLRRPVAIADIGDRMPANGMNNDETDYVPNFEMFKGMNPKTKTVEMIQTSLQREIRMPQEAAEQGLAGRVNIEAIIEADGAISQVKVLRSPHEILSRTAMDCIYRLYCFPAKAGNTAVATKLSIPIIFQLP